MVAITPDDVRQLLAADDQRATLVVIGGSAAVVSPEELDSDAYAGAVMVADRASVAAASNLDLEHPSDTDLEALAARLSVSVNSLGG